MRFLSLLILFVVAFAVSACGSDNASLHKTQDEFINAYNEKVPADLRLVMLDEGYMVKVDQFDKYPGTERFRFGCSVGRMGAFLGQDELTALNAHYEYRIEPNGCPSRDGLSKMEQMFVATIESLDDGWFTDAKGILDELGLYSQNGPNGNIVNKNGFSYTLRITDATYDLYIHPEDAKK